MTSTIRKVIVLGAGGSLGPSVLKCLQSNFIVSILTRESSTSTFPTQFTIHTVADSYPTDGLLLAFQGQDAVVSCISPWASDVQKRIIDVAVQAGVKRFIPAEFGYDTTNAQAIRILPALQQRVDIVTHLKSKERFGLTWTGVITSTFLDWGISNGFLGFDLATRKAMIYDDGGQLFSASTVSMIGTAVTNILLNPDTTANQYKYISSVTTTQNEILGVLQRLDGVPWDVTKVNSRNKIKEAHDSFAVGGDPVAASRLLILALLYTPGNGTNFSGRDSNEELKLPQDNIETILKSVLKSKKNVAGAFK